MWTEQKLLDHLRSRGMEPTLYQLSLSAEDASVTFPLYNGTSQWVGYQAYKPDNTSKKANDPELCRYYTYLPRETDGVFGLEVQYDSPDIYVVEGVFKAGVLHRLGYNAIAVLTSHPKRLLPWFKILKQTKNLIAIGDNDPAGMKLVNTIENGFISPVDLDEMMDYEVVQMLKSYSAGGNAP